MHKHTTGMHSEGHGKHAGRNLAQTVEGWLGRLPGGRGADVEQDLGLVYKGTAAQVQGQRALRSGGKGFSMECSCS